MESVTLLLNKDGKVCGVWFNADDARAQAKRMNDDPFIAAGEPDQGAPYSVETWGVKGGSVVMRTYKIRIELPGQLLEMKLNAGSLSEAIESSLQGVASQAIDSVVGLTCITIKPTLSAALPQADLGDGPTSTQTGTASPPRQTEERAGGRRVDETCVHCGHSYESHVSPRSTAIPEWGIESRCFGRKSGFVGGADHV